MRPPYPSEILKIRFYGMYKNQMRAWVYRAFTYDSTEFAERYDAVLQLETDLDAMLSGLMQRASDISPMTFLEQEPGIAGKLLPTAVFIPEHDFDVSCTMLSLDDARSLEHLSTRAGLEPIAREAAILSIKGQITPFTARVERDDHNLVGFDTDFYHAALSQKTAIL